MDGHDAPISRGGPAFKGHGYPIEKPFEALHVFEELHELLPSRGSNSRHEVEPEPHEKDDGQPPGDSLTHKLHSNLLHFYRSS